MLTSTSWSMLSKKPFMSPSINPLCTCKSPLNACQAIVALRGPENHERCFQSAPHRWLQESSELPLAQACPLRMVYQEGRFLPFFFEYIHPFSGMRLVGFIPKCFDETFQFFNAHLVDSLTICAWSHIAWLRIYALIGNEEHLFVDQNAASLLKLIVRDLNCAGIMFNHLDFSPRVSLFSLFVLKLLFSPSPCTRFSLAQTTTGSSVNLSDIQANPSP